MNVAIQGQAGSFHDQVARQWYGKCQIIPCATFADVFEAFSSGEADAIVTAVENSIYGSINDVYQLIESCEAPIIGEVKLEVDQCLIAHEQINLANITDIYSHPVALAQCRETLHTLCPNAELIEYFDTAGAVEYVKSLDSAHAAAVASSGAAELYKAKIIKKSVQDSRHNYTRFLVLEPREPDAHANRSSLVITTNHQPGALVEVLNIFAKANINLVKLQSQPIIGEPWKYKFFIVVDCAGEKLRELVRDIERNEHQVILLGEYKAA